METSDHVKISAPAVASPNGRLLATLEKGSLQIRAIPLLYIIYDIKTPSKLEFSLKNPPVIRWSPVQSSTSASPSSTSRRILLADEQHVWVFSLEDNSWSATVDNGSASMGKIVSVEFGSNESEVVVFADFNSRMTLWNVESGRAVEIKSPKFATAKCGYGYRPCFGSGSEPDSGHTSTRLFALLSRVDAQDILLLLAVPSYALVKNVVLPTTDAQGIKWSPDGRWLLIWEAASLGYKIYVYTADGNLYRAYGGRDVGDGENVLGVKSVEWSPKGDILAIGDYAKRVTLLNTRTFSPIVFLEHTSEVQLQHGDVWEEHIQPSTGQHTYALSHQPIHPPSHNNPPSNNHNISSSHLHPSTSSSMSNPNGTSIPTAPKTGVSTLTFNADGTLVATREDTTPTTVWIWNVVELVPRAVLIHGTLVKSIFWHPADPDLLLIECLRETSTARVHIQSQNGSASDDTNTVLLYLWSNATGPEILNVPFYTEGGVGRGRVDARWLPAKHAPPTSTTTSTSSSSPSRILLSSAHACQLIGLPTLHSPYDTQTTTTTTTTTNNNNNNNANHNHNHNHNTNTTNSTYNANILHNANISHRNKHDNDATETLDDISFASFDFTAAPSTFEHTTGSCMTRTTGVSGRKEVDVGGTGGLEGMTATTATALMTTVVDGKTLDGTTSTVSDEFF